MLPASEFARLWKTLPHLTPEEAELFELDIRAARDSFPPEKDRWGDPPPRDIAPHG
jgi:hypothetical protein